jgi:Tfp pilus assembly protein PilP
MKRKRRRRRMMTKLRRKEKQMVNMLLEMQLPKLESWPQMQSTDPTSLASLASLSSPFADSPLKKG